MPKYSRQNPEFREADLPADTLERFSDDDKIIRFKGACVFTLNKRARKGYSVALVQDGDGLVQFVTESGATLVNRSGHDALAGNPSAAALIVTENEDGQSAKFVLSGDTAASS